MRKNTKDFIASDGKLRVGNVVGTKTSFPGSSSSFVYCLQRRKSEGMRMYFVHYVTEAGEELALSLIGALLQKREESGCGTLGIHWSVN